MEMNAFFKPGIDTPLSPSDLNDLERGGSSEKPVGLDKEEDKENSPPTILMSKRLTEPPDLLRCRLFGRPIEKTRICV